MVGEGYVWLLEMFNEVGDELDDVQKLPHVQVEVVCTGVFYGIIFYDDGLGLAYLIKGLDDTCVMAHQLEAPTVTTELLTRLT